MITICKNTATIYNSDSFKLEELKNMLFKADGFFQRILPCPKTEQHDWYGWNYRNWGTGLDADFIQIFEIDDNTFTIDFTTENDPPTLFYEHMEREGWEIKAYYSCPDQSFCGKYENALDSCYYYDLHDRSTCDIIPDEIFVYAMLDMRLKLLKENS